MRDIKNLSDSVYYHKLYDNASDRTILISFKCMTAGGPIYRFDCQSTNINCNNGESSACSSINYVSMQGDHNNLWFSYGNSKETGAGYVSWLA